MGHNIANIKSTFKFASVLIAVLFFAVSCEKSESTSEDKGLIANNDSGNNYMLAFLGDSTDIPANTPAGSKNGSGSLEDLLGGLGENGGSNNGGAGMELTQSTNPTGAGTGNGAANATIRSVLQMMVSNASGQVPVFCVEPKELADDFFFDPPAGYLPINPMNATKTGAENRECSR